MYVPRSWFQTKSEIDTKDGKRLLVAWGFGDDEAQARAEAGRRLQRLSQHWLGAASEGDEYDYGDRPMREEILQALGPEAILTRNRHGAVVLNAARLLFLDVDLPPVGPPSGLARIYPTLVRLFAGKYPEEMAIERLRDALREAAPAVTFRLYRTAAGLRALAVDRAFDPAGPETQALMEKTGTDPAFARLCRVQKSFRARLTPKPWRCGCSKPPGEHPRSGQDEQREFANWCEEYAHAIEGHATCRFLETVGASRAIPTLQPLIELHDRVTRCAESLPLA
jgi:hypothetical protein